MQECEAFLLRGICPSIAAAQNGHPAWLPRAGVRRAAVRDGDLVELDEASRSAGAQRGDGGYEGVYMVGLQVCVERSGVGVDLVEVEASGGVAGLVGREGGAARFAATWRTSSTMRSRKASARPGLASRTAIIGRGFRSEVSTWRFP